MRSIDESQPRLRKDNNNDDDTEDPTAPFYEQQAFDSIWHGLKWKQIRTRVPICFHKTIRSRYMLANIVFLGYAIGILIIDFDTSLSESADNSGAEINGGSTTTTSIATLDESITSAPLINRLYFGFAIVHLISAFLYWWAWRDKSWLNIIMIPEYLNHVEAVLYIWSAVWYSREDTIFGYYTLAVHKIELAAAIVELVASFGWIMSWYLTYTRTLGRGFSLDDPDTVAYLCTTIASIIYLVYNIQINIHPEHACFYIFAALRDDHWFWFLPMAGQYGVAPGKIHVETKKVLPKYGKSDILIIDLCKRHHAEGIRKNSVIITIH